MTVNRSKRPGDLAPFLEPGPSAGLDVIQGVVTAFDPDTNENTVELAGGRTETDLPIIGTSSFTPDQPVMVLRNRTRYFILGPIGGSQIVGTAWNRSTSTVNVTSTSVVGSGFGVSFTAPTSGRVSIVWRDRLSLDKTGGMLRRLESRVQVRTGTTIGSGTIVYAHNADDTVELGMNVSGSMGVRSNSSSIIEVGSLTPGDAYNAEILYTLNAIADTTASSVSRSIQVKGLP